MEWGVEFLREAEIGSPPTEEPTRAPIEALLVVVQLVVEPPGEFIQQRHDVRAVLHEGDL